MAQRWFRVKSEGTGQTGDGIRPMFRDRVDAHTGVRINPQQWVVLFDGDPAALDSIAAEPQATELVQTAAVALINAANRPELQGSGRPWNPEDLPNKFKIRRPR